MKIDFFEMDLNTKDIAHAYLFECNDSKKSHNLVDNLIKKILCTSNLENFMFCGACKSCQSFDGNSNPDYLEILPDDKDKIGIGSLRGDSNNRGIINVLNETSLLSDAKIIKINSAEKLNEEAQNYLLKILEEPPKNSHIFMLSSRPYRLKKTILSRLIRIKIYKSPIKDQLDEKKFDSLFSEILYREYDVDSLSQEDIQSLLELYEDTIESLEEYNFSKNTIMDTWNDDHLNFRLNILKQNIFNKIINQYKNKNYKSSLIISSINEERLFLFLEEIISFQALLANKIPVNKKVQLDSIFDVIN